MATSTTVVVMSFGENINLTSGITTTSWLFVRPAILKFLPHRGHERNCLLDTLRGYFDLDKSSWFEAPPFGGYLV
jgi:hypothetical protein